MRRLFITTVGLMVLSLGSHRAGDSGDPGTIGPRPGGPALAEARLLAIERENGCLDDGAQAPQDSWPPGWKQATIAAGDIQPARVISDPYPTLHSVVVDSGRNKVFMSDPNRHALWSYDRLPTSKGPEQIEPPTGIRGPAPGLMFTAPGPLTPQHPAASHTCT